MKVIRINTTQDVWECDTCGTDWAEGGEIFVDDILVDEVVPVAHCYGGTSATDYELLLLALAHLGIRVEVDGCKPHVSCFEVEEKLTETLLRESYGK